MLDLHAIGITPGAGLTLGAVGAVIPSNDGASQAGVPIDSGAVLKAWGMLSVTANTIAALQLLSQDMVDQQNGEYLTPGATNLGNCVWDWDNLPYNKGLRQFYAGTNTGVTAALAVTLDDYPQMAQKAVTKGSRVIGKQVTPPSLTFGGAVNSGWTSLAFAPTKPLPNGRYAILGAKVSAITNLALIRFQHTDFQGLSPGFICVNSGIISSSSFDKVPKDPLFLTEDGNQFVKMGEILGEGVCPVFTVGNNTTGLQIQMYSLQADTPVVQLVMAQVG
jgi:hypothetical protein